MQTVAGKDVMMTLLWSFHWLNRHFGVRHMCLFVIRSAGLKIFRSAIQKKQGKVK